MRDGVVGDAERDELPASDHLVLGRRELRREAIQLEWMQSLDLCPGDCIHTLMLSDKPCRI
jgi:hypothetical protein